MKHIYILSKVDLEKRETLIVSTDVRKITKCLKDKYNISDTAKKDLLAYGRTVWFDSNGLFFTFELELVEPNKFLG